MPESERRRNERDLPVHSPGRGAAVAPGGGRNQARPERLPASLWPPVLLGPFEPLRNRLPRECPPVPTPAEGRDASGRRRTRHNHPWSSPPGARPSAKRGDHVFPWATWPLVSRRCFTPPGYLRSNGAACPIPPEAGTGQIRATRPATMKAHAWSELDPVKSPTHSATAHSSDPAR